VPFASERAVNWKAGVGMQCAFTPAFSMRAEIQRYRINDAVGILVQPLPFLRWSKF
jgi:OOP family OmpA-OmpF porin